MRRSYFEELRSYGVKPNALPLVFVGGVRLIGEVRLVRSIRLVRPIGPVRSVRPVRTPKARTNYKSRNC